MTALPARKIFSFADWELNHPGETYPGDRVDAQFAEHQRALENLNRALSNLLRADGRLNHDLLTLDSIPQDFLAQVTAKAHQTTETLIDSAKALLAGQKAQADRLEALELSLLAELDETKIRGKKAVEINLAARATQAQFQRAADAAMNKIATALDAASDALNDQNWAALQANTAQDWALVSTTWAEYMDGNATIPPNILASNSITGDHWSSRWWANRAASAFGMMAWWYLGAWPGPPPSTPSTPTGQPIPPGGMYFDTVLGTMLIWNGSTWVPLAQGPAKATTSSLYYTSAAGQTVFPLTVADRFGQTFHFNQTNPEGLHAHINGVRLEPVYDYSLDTVNSVVTFLRPVVLNSIATFDLLAPASQLAPSGSANTVLVSPITPDGIKTTFTGLTVAANGAPLNVQKNEELSVSVDGVIQQPGLSYSASGSTLTFTEAPLANANVFIIWYGPAGAGGSAGLIVPGPLDVKAQVVPGAGALSINRAAGENVLVNLTGSVTSIAIAPWPAGGTTGKVRFIFVNSGAFTVGGWPAGTIWPGGTPPSITSGAGKRDIVHLMTDDAGVTIYGSIIGQDYR